MPKIAAASSSVGGAHSASASQRNSTASTIAGASHSSTTSGTDGRSTPRPRYHRAIPDTTTDAPMYTAYAVHDPDKTASNGAPTSTAVWITASGKNRALPPTVRWSIPATNPITPTSSATRI